MQQIKVGIRDAKANLSRLLQYVQAGAEVIITERGKPVGKIVPVAQGNLPLAERLAELERWGWVEPAGKKKPKSLPPPIPLPEDIAQKFLQRDREL